MQKKTDEYEKAWRLCLMNKFLDFHEAKYFFDKAFGFDTGLSMPKDYRNGHYQIFDARGRFERARLEPDFPYNESYDWEALMRWIGDDPFDIVETGRYMNFHWKKEYHELYLKSDRM